MPDQRAAGVVPIAAISGSRVASTFDFDSSWANAGLRPLGVENCSTQPSSMDSRVQGMLNAMALIPSATAYMNRQKAGSVGLEKAFGCPTADAVINTKLLVAMAMKTQAKMAKLLLMAMDQWAMAEVCQIAPKP
jgi:hypothetical protein